MKKQKKKINESKLVVFIDENLKKKAKAKASILGLTIKDYITRLLEVNTQNMEK